MVEGGSWYSLKLVTINDIKVVKLQRFWDFFHPDPFGDDPLWRAHIFFKWVGSSGAVACWKSFLIQQCCKAMLSNNLLCYPGMHNVYGFTSSISICFKRRSRQGYQWIIGYICILLFYIYRHMQMLPSYSKKHKVLYDLYTYTFKVYSTSTLYIYTV